MKNKGLIISTGFALFSMFFGSGNLVFPITVGQESGGNYLFAAIGILLTGVLVPFLGVIGMMLYQGNLQNFFSSFGKRGTFIFSFFALALMGPFGVLARCLTVAHGAVLLLFPNASLYVTSFTLCIIIYLLTLNKNKIIALLGNYLTPLLLIAIAAIAFFGLTHRTFPDVSESNQWVALKNGFFQGYQTMDLLAAFFFSQFIIQNLSNQLSNDIEKKKMHKIFFNASIIGAGILSIIYFILVLLGWMYSPFLSGKPPQEMLGFIALDSLGYMSAPFLCLTIIFACLTTAIVLTSLFSDFLQNEVSKGKIGNKQGLWITLSIGFAVSTLEFGGIAKFLGPVLEVVYPAMIVLTIVNISCKVFRIEATHWPFTLTIVAKLCTL